MKGQRLKEAKRLHHEFMTGMYANFGLFVCPRDHPVGFMEILSLGGLIRHRTRGLKIVLNDLFLIDSLDILQFQQTVFHESGHLLHLYSNGFPNDVYNAACSEPVGSMIADYATLVFLESSGRRTEAYYEKLSDEAGPSIELFEVARKSGMENPSGLLRKLSRQNVGEIYQTVRDYLQRDYLYEDPETEGDARGLL
ncbi:MAG: hypothetical protein PHF67_02145 [Candidatus Nanoarchaeia archaeon]|nr:hypothetical protein [Candidatus Nanoarchaeia archaeon]